MLKDLLDSLRQGAAEAQSRRETSHAVIQQLLDNQSYASSAIPDSSLPSGISAGATGGGLSRITGSMPVGKLGDLVNAIRAQESGGNYHVVNGIGAMGAYQIMPSNIDGPGGWDKQVLGRNITRSQFLNNPGLQDQIARGVLGGYFKQYGAAGAAKAWYAGPGNARVNSNAPQYGGPSINAYAASVLNRMRNR